MSEFSPVERRRWEAWQRASELSARRSERLMRYSGLAVLGAALIGLAIALWR